MPGGPSYVSPGTRRRNRTQPSGRGRRLRRRRWLRNLSPGILWGGSRSKYRIEVQRDGVFSIQGARPRLYTAGERMLVSSRRPVTVREYSDEESALAAWSAHTGDA